MTEGVAPVAEVKADVFAAPVVAPVVPAVAPAVAPIAAPVVAPVVPAEVVYALKAPEGYEAADVAETVAFAKANKLSIEAAQAVLDRESAIEASAAKAATEVQQKNAEAAAAKWESDAKSDPQIGGLNFDTALKRTNDVVARFSDPAFAKEVAAAGSRLPPGFIRMCNAFALATADDKPPRSSGDPISEPRDPATVLYGAKKG